jgi:hypothetical protein
MDIIGNIASRSKYKTLLQQFTESVFTDERSVTVCFGSNQ